MKIILTIFAALLSVTASSSLIIEAEARGADEPCSYLHPSWSINPNTGICESNIRHSSSPSSSSSVKQLDNVGSNAIIAAMERQKAAQAAQTGQFGSLQINCGQGTVLNGNLCVIDTLNGAFLPIANLFGGKLFGLGAKNIVNWYTKILDNQSLEVAAVLSYLAESCVSPTIYHCHGGKDRTGLITALLLSIADVNRKEIAKDYSLSAIHLIKPFFIAGVLDGRSPKEYTVKDFERDYCPKDAIVSTLKHLDVYYGGPVNYLLINGVTNKQIKILKNALLQ